MSSLVTPGSVLPENAVPSGAFEDARPLPTPAVGSAVNYSPDGAYYEVLDSFFAVLSTDATVGNRTPVLRLLDANGSRIYDIPASGTIGPSSSGAIVAGSNFGNAYSPGTGFFVIPTPPITLYPGYTLRMTWQGAGAADAMTIPYLVTVKVPSGPHDTDPPRTPTPILL